MIGTLEADLARGLDALGIPVEADARARLLDYLDLLAKWNRSYNLTAVREPGRMVNVHLLDSLAILPYVRGPRIADVGSGAGLPGIPLAIVRPQWDFVLLDSNIKKVRFMRQAVMELGLERVSVEHVRVESYRPGEPFDTVVSRAFAAIADFIRVAGALTGRHGRLLAMKGRFPADELGTLPADWRQRAVYQLQIPGLDAERHLVELERGPD